MLLGDCFCCIIVNLLKCFPDLFYVGPRKLCVDLSLGVDDVNRAGQLAVVGSALIFHRVNKDRHWHLVFVFHFFGQGDAFSGRLRLPDLLEGHLAGVRFLLVDDQDFRFGTLPFRFGKNGLFDF